MNVKDEKNKKHKITLIDLAGELIEIAYKKRLIPTDLFIELLKNKMISWSWEELLIFTQFTKFGN